MVTRRVSEAAGRSSLTRRVTNRFTAYRRKYRSLSQSENRLL